MKNLWLVLTVLGIGAPAGAQTDVFMRTQDPAARASMDKTDAEKQKLVGELRAKIAVEARITPGAPYTAEAVTESAQVLGDGNRINSKSLTRVYRDGEGRTRGRKSTRPVQSSAFPLWIQLRISVTCCSRRHDWLTGTRVGCKASSCGRRSTRPRIGTPMLSHLHLHLHLHLLHLRMGLPFAPQYAKPACASP